MAPSPERYTDEQVEVTVSDLLRVGVTLAATVVILGAIIYLIRNGGSMPEDQVFHGEPADLREIFGILQEVRAVRGRAIIQLGILLLILTPVARVAFSVFAFWKERDRLYVIITLIVLTVLVRGLLATE
jgi:uncharacterized membrane protein